MFKFHICGNQQTYVAVVCSGIELNDQCLKKNHYLGEAIGTKESEVESVIARIRSR